MSSYFIALIDIWDHERYQQYLDGYDKVFKKYKGQVLAVKDNPKILEGEWPAGRTVLIRFPSNLELYRWYESDEYQMLAGHRREASTAAIAIISGSDKG
jgi:uncharacterized protein (DUF1330 family)